MKKAYTTPDVEILNMDNIIPLCVSRNVGLSSKEATPSEVLIDSRDFPAEGLVDFDNLW